MAEDIVMDDAEFWVVSLKEQYDDDGGVSHVIEADAEIVEEIRDHASTEGRVSTFGMSDEILNLGTVCSHGSFLLAVLNARREQYRYYDMQSFTGSYALSTGSQSRRFDFSRHAW